MARIVVHTDLVTPGENLLLQRLEAELPETWVAFVGHELVVHDTSVEIDFVVVGQHGVYVLEEKHWRGRITGTDQQWVLDSGESRGSPINQAVRNARRVAGFLRERAVSSHLIGRGDHFVWPFVVLTAEPVSVNVHDQRARSMVRKLDEIVEELVGCDRALAEQGISIERCRSAVIKELEGLPPRPSVPPQIDRFEVVDKRPGPGYVRSFEATWRDQRYVLKLAAIDRPADVRLLEREQEVLSVLRQRPALAGHVPADSSLFSWSDGQYLVLAVQLPEGETLGARRERFDPGRREFLQFVREAFGLLAEIHAAGVVHRNLNPRSVWFGPDGLLFTEFLVAHVDSETTVAALADAAAPSDPYRAPECRELSYELAQEPADVYSLACCALYYLTGVEPESEQQKLPQVWYSALDALKPTTLADLLRRALESDDRRRPAAAELAQAAAAAEEPAEPVMLQPGTEVDGRCRIERVLGVGGSAVTYLAFDVVRQERVVLKQIKTRKLYGLVQRELHAAKDLHHPRLRRLYDIYPMDHPYHLKMEYVDGLCLHELAEHFRGNLQACRELAFGLLDVIRYFEAHGLLHRDIKPQNIIADAERPETEFKLIDYGLATPREEARSIVGTPAYQPPEVDEGKPFPQTGDLYSLAVMLFELYTGQKPFPRLPDGRYKKRELVEIETLDVEEEHFLGVLRKALSPDPEARFRSADEMEAALRRSAVEPVFDESTKCLSPQINPFVDHLRRAYRASAIGNTENRGLDSDFARQTYVPTGLDQHLAPRILEGRHRLVLLTGNAGDGKTAFLQRLLEQARQRGAVVRRDDRWGWEFELQGRRFVALYDASESRGDFDADESLCMTLDPYLDPYQRDRYTALIAINDGRLFEFFTVSEAFSELWNDIQKQREQPDPEAPVRVVDLKRRCLCRVDGERGASFTRRLIRSWTADEHWQPCRQCSAQSYCPIYFNVQTLQQADHEYSPLDRLEILLGTVHLQRVMRPTVRDLRSLLAYVITADLGCEDVHRWAESGPQDWLGYLYFNTVFEPSQTDDPLFRQLQILDPAKATSPVLSRFLSVAARGLRDGVVEGLVRLDRAANATLQQHLRRLGVEHSIVPTKGRLDAILRLVFFELEPQQFEQLELESLYDLLPYRALERFRDALTGRWNEADLLGWIAQGLAQFQGLPPAVANDANGQVAYMAVALAADGQRGFCVVRRYPLSQFQCHPSGTADPAVDAAPDALLLEHGSSGARLLIGLDLFELLWRAREGYWMSALEQQPFRQEVHEFKQMLLKEAAREVMLQTEGHEPLLVRVAGKALVAAEVKA